MKSISASSDTVLESSGASSYTVFWFSSICDIEIASLTSYGYVLLVFVGVSTPEKNDTKLGELLFVFYYDHESLFVELTK